MIFFDKIRCAICSKGINDPTYLKDPDNGESLYWANPTHIKIIDQPVYFCGPRHGTEWFLKNMANKEIKSENADTKISEL